MVSAGQELCSAIASPANLTKAATMHCIIWCAGIHASATAPVDQLAELQAAGEILWHLVFRLPCAVVILQTLLLGHAA